MGLSPTQADDLTTAGEDPLQPANKAIAIGKVVSSFVANYN
jgi:hypothetical protein